MSRRYKKIKEDMPLLAAKIEDDTPRQVASQAAILTSFIFFYLLLTPSIYMASGACET